MQLLDPETAKTLQFLDPDSVEMDKKNSGSRNRRNGAQQPNMCPPNKVPSPQLSLALPAFNTSDGTPPQVTGMERANTHMEEWTHSLTFDACKDDWSREFQQKGGPPAAQRRLLTLFPSGLAPSFPPVYIPCT